jgi:hypothetical protein
MEIRFIGYERLQIIGTDDPVEIYRCNECQKEFTLEEAENEQHE